ncbi:hypothetical protein LPJ69_001671 [Coemansia sp. RSA 1752]|nr:hypothetical protein LPJ69_001671 [Coemansia sp. RSA 1752]
MASEVRSGQRQQSHSSSESPSEPSADTGSRDEREGSSEEPSAYSQLSKPDIGTPRIGQNIESTDDSDRDSSRNGTGVFNPRSRQRKRPQGSATSTPDQTRLDPESANRAQRGGGSKGGSTLHIPCKFFKHGNCTAGTGCYFSHDINLFVDKAACKYFTKGNCRYGNKCALTHIGQNDGIPGRNQKTNNGALQRIQQNRPASSNNSSGRGNSRNGINPDGTPKKDRKGSNDASYSEAAGGHSGVFSERHGNGSNLTSALAQAYAQQSAGGARTHSTASAVSSSSVHDDPASGINSSDNSMSNKKPTNPWATGSVASQMLRDREPRVSPAAAQKERRRFADSGVSDSGPIGMRSAGLRNRPVDADGDVPEYLLAGDQYNSGSLSPLRAHFENIRGNSGVSEAEINSRSQPIPKPSASSYNRAMRGNSSLPYGGLSIQESLMIDNLTLSHGAANQSFAGSPFMATSIPLLDHFKDIARGDAGSTGTSPHAQSFTRSPMIGSSGFLLNRHAFSAVDSNPLAQEAFDGDISGSSSLRPGYHGHLQSQHLDMSPAVYPVGGAQSIPLANDMFGRSLRPSSLANEPRSPLSSFNGMNGELVDNSAQAAFLGSPNSAGGITPGSGRLRSNSNAKSPSIGGLSSGLDINGYNSRLATVTGAGRVPTRDTSALLSGESRLAGYSLNGVGSLPYEPGLESNSGIWDSHSGVGSARDIDPRYSLSNKAPGMQRPGASYGQQPGSLSNYYQQSTSPFATAVGSLGDYRQQQQQPQQQHMAQSRMAFGLPSGEGAIGQRLHQNQSSAFGAAPGAPRSYPYSGGLSGSFGGIGSSMFAIEAGRGKNRSANGSSPASDNIDELFELEQDVPAQSRSNSNNSLAPNPPFISMDGFSHKFSGLSLNRSEGSGGNLAQSASSSRSIPSISAIARPAA